MSNLQLTDDQQAAYEAFVSYIIDPHSVVFVLKGYAGTGKSTLVNKLLTDLPATLQTAKLLNQEDKDWEVVLTATTNKAADALSSITNEPVSTIHSYLGLRVHTDYAKGTTSLERSGRWEQKENAIIFIDEASYIDSKLLNEILLSTNNCKLIFIGDPAQLAPVKSKNTPVFQAGFSGATLTQVVRQAEGNPIIDMATTFRNVVNGEPWSKLPVDGHYIKHVNRDLFDQEVLNEFNRSNWHHNDSKVLAWTNKTVIGYNHGIRDVVEGVPELQVGDYAVCNHYINNGTTCKIKTDQTVQITQIHKAQSMGIAGWDVEMDYQHRAFLPASLDDKKQVLRKLKTEKRYRELERLERKWIDLRAAYACTINKSQGSTYDRVFIDLDDVAKCNSGNNIARMLYVAVSRAREQVVLTGDLA